jgi:hypothetical protein
MPIFLQGTRPNPERTIIVIKYQGVSYGNIAEILSSMCPLSGHTDWIMWCWGKNLGFITMSYLIANDTMSWYLQISKKKSKSFFFVQFIWKRHVFMFSSKINIKLIWQCNIYPNIYYAQIWYQELLVIATQSFCKYKINMFWLHTK